MGSATRKTHQHPKAWPCWLSSTPIRWPLLLVGFFPGTPPGSLPLAKAAVKRAFGDDLPRCIATAPTFKKFILETSKGKNVSQRNDHAKIPPHRASSQEQTPRKKFSSLGWGVVGSLGACVSDPARQAPWFSCDLEGGVAVGRFGRSQAHATGVRTVAAATEQVIEMTPNHGLGIEQLPGGDGPIIESNSRQHPTFTGASPIRPRECPHPWQLWTRFSFCRRPLLNTGQQQQSGSRHQLSDCSPS